MVYKTGGTIQKIYGPGYRNEPTLTVETIPSGLEIDYRSTMGRDFPYPDPNNGDWRASYQIEIDDPDIAEQVEGYTFTLSADGFEPITFNTDDSGGLEIEEVTMTPLLCVSVLSDGTSHYAIKDAAARSDIANLQTNKVPTSRKINNKDLTSDITLNASDVGALPDSTIIPAAQIQSDWNQSDNTALDYIKNKPTIPSGVVVDQVFDATSENAQSGVAINGAGFLTDIDSTDVTNALGYTPYDSSNPDGYITSASLPTVNDATLTIQKNSTNVGTFTANASSNATINITVPTTASDVSALPSSTKYGASISLSVNSSTYVVTAQLKDQDGNNLGSAQTIDLPLESVVVSGSYDDATKKVILTLQNGSTIEFSIADLVSGLQTEITNSNMLDADLVDDSTSTNKFVTASEKTLISTALQPSDISNMATTNTNQTFTASKEFSANPSVSNNQPNIYIKSQNITKGTAPSAAKYSWFGTIFDNTGTNQKDKMAQIYHTYYNNGLASLNFEIFNPTADSTATSKIALLHDGTNTYATAPTPTEDTNNSVQIDTVGARNTKLANYVDISTNQTVGGTKTFTGIIQSQKTGAVLSSENPNISGEAWNIRYNSANTSMFLGRVLTGGTWSDGITYKLNTNEISLSATGGVTTTTQSLTDSSTKIATDEFVRKQPGLLWYGTSSSAANATEKVVVISGYDSALTPEVGQCLVVKPTNTSTVANSTIKIVDSDNNVLLAAKDMRYNNVAITTSTDSVVWNANYPTIFMYDGTYWVFLAHGVDSNTTYSAMSVAEGITGTATSQRTMRADYLKQIIQGTTAKIENSTFKIYQPTLSHSRYGHFWLFVFPDGHNVLYDCGYKNEGTSIAEFLSSVNVSHIDVVIISHFHGDHAGSAPYIINNYCDSSTIFYKCMDADYSQFTEDEISGAKDYEDAYKNALSAKGYTYTIPTNKSSVSLFDGNVELTFYNTDTSNLSTYYNSTMREATNSTANNTSMCCLVRAYGTSVFMTGDIEYNGQQAIADYVPQNVDILQVPHHGLNKNGYYKFFDRLNAKVAMFQKNDVTSDQETKYICRYIHYTKNIPLLNNANSTGIELECYNGNVKFLNGNFIDFLGGVDDNNVQHILPAPRDTVHNAKDFASWTIADVVDMLKYGVKENIRIGYDYNTTTLISQLNSLVSATSWIITPHIEYIEIQNRNSMSTAPKRAKSLSDHS